MDTFMDQLSQKLNAQEIIRANGEAESEQMKVMRVQVKEYQDALDRMKSVVDQLGGLQGQIAALTDSQAAASSALTEEAVADLKNQIAEIGRGNSEQFENMRRETQEQRSQMDKVSQDLSGIDSRIEALAQQQADPAAYEKMLNDMQGQLEDMNRQSGSMIEDMQKNLLGSLGSGDDFHKECVRVYRNVQAVVQDECGKITEANQETIQELTKQVGKLKGGITAATIVAAVAAVASVVSVVISFLF